MSSLNIRSILPDFCKSTSNETVFRGLAPSFIGASLGDMPSQINSQGYSVEAPTRDRQI